MVDIKYRTDYNASQALLRRKFEVWETLNEEGNTAMNNQLQYYGGVPKTPIPWKHKTLEEGTHSTLKDIF